MLKAYPRAPQHPEVRRILLEGNDEIRNRNVFENDKKIRPGKARTYKYLSRATSAHSRPHFVLDFPEVEAFLLAPLFFGSI